MLGPVLAQTVRPTFIAAGSFWLSARGATAQNFFALAASSMVLLGSLSCLSVILTRWGPKRAPVTAVCPLLSIASEQINQCRRLSAGLTHVRCGRHR
jgi:hypothetical protein